MATTTWGVRGISEDSDCCNDCCDCDLNCLLVVVLIARFVVVVALLGLVCCFGCCRCGLTTLERCCDFSIFEILKNYLSNVDEGVVSV